MSLIRDGGSQNKTKWGADPQTALGKKFLSGAIVLLNTYQGTKFQLPNSTIFGDMEQVPK